MRISIDAASLGGEDDVGAGGYYNEQDHLPAYDEDHFVRPVILHREDGANIYFFLLYILFPLVYMGLLLLVGTLLNKHFPTALSLLTGGRGKKKSKKNDREKMPATEMNGRSDGEERQYP